MKNYAKMLSKAKDATTRIFCDGHDLIIEAITSNYTMQIKYYLYEKFISGGVLTVDKNLLENVFKNISNISSISVDDFVLTIESNRKKFNIPCRMESGKLEEIEVKKGNKIDNDIIKSIVKTVKPAITDDKIRPMLCSYHFNFDNDMEVVGCDGHRLIVRKFNIDISENFKINMPVDVMEILNVCKDDVYMQENGLIKCGDVFISTKGIEGDYLNYKQLIKRDGGVEVNIYREQIEEYLKEIKTSKKKVSKVDIDNINEREIKFAYDGDFKYSQIIEANVGGDIGHSFNALFLKDMCKTFKEVDELYMTFIKDGVIVRSKDEKIKELMLKVYRG